MQPVVTVIGTTFMDCKGFSQEQYRPLARNLGSVEFVDGGVGRNVAVNLNGLGLPVFFVSSADRSPAGKGALDKLRQCGLDTRFIKETEQRGLGIWLAILDSNGDLAGSISQMPDLTGIRETLAEQGEEIARLSTHFALELDLNADISRLTLALGHRYGLPVYGLPGNLELILKHREMLAQLECFICNDIEAERLWEEDFRHSDIGRMERQIADCAKRDGLKSLVVTLGDKGSVYYDRASEKCGHRPAEQVRLVDTSGAGDAFFSGTIAGLIRGLPLPDAVVWGTKIAAWTIESPENTCPSLSEHAKELYRSGTWT